MTTCTVIIPIGPGHEELAQSALQSVMLASEEMGKFDDIYTITGDDTKGEIGRSAARNAMARDLEPWMAIFTTALDEDLLKAFHTEWLFFLDADDVMCSHSIHGISPFHTASSYLDDYDCIWGSIYELHQTGEVFKRKQIDRITTYEAYVKTPAFLSCQMGHFVRRSAFGGFNEDMDVCEDVEWYLRAWKNLRCIKQEKPLFLNRRGAHSWTKNEGLPTGRDWSMQADRMLKAARERMGA